MANEKDVFMEGSAFSSKSFVPGLFLLSRNSVDNFFLKKKVCYFLLQLLS